MDEPFDVGVHLFRSDERAAEVDAFVARTGERVGVPGVLADLNRAARRTAVPGRAAAWGFTWNTEDSRSQRWFPQGITTSADQGEPEQVDGRSVVCTSWYSRHRDGLCKGSRVTFVDITDRDDVRYRHVLLVEALVSPSGQIDVRPVRIHAGGIVWHGPYLHVAGTARGIFTFHFDDIVEVSSFGDRGSLGLREDGGVDSFGYRYLLPVRFTYDALADDGYERLRYSFLSVDRSARPHHLVAGEYGRRGMTTRLVRFELDEATSLLRTGEEGRSRPVHLHTGGVSGMQGATVVDGTFYVTTSAGRYGRGSLYVGQPGEFRKFARVLPAGPEDITYWPSTGQLWSLTEYPARRFVFAMNRSDFS